MPYPEHSSTKPYIFDSSLIEPLSLLVFNRENCPESPLTPPGIHLSVMGNPCPHRLIHAYSPLDLSGCALADGIALLGEPQTTADHLTSEGEVLLPSASG